MMLGSGSIMVVLLCLQSTLMEDSVAYAADKGCIANDLRVTRVQRHGKARQEYTMSKLIRAGSNVKIPTLIAGEAIPQTEQVTVYSRNDGPRTRAESVRLDKEY